MQQVQLELKAAYTSSLRLKAAYTSSLRLSGHRRLHHAAVCRMCVCVYVGGWVGGSVGVVHVL
jgi:hypothetical protein